MLFCGSLFVRTVGVKTLTALTQCIVICKEITSSYSVITKRNLSNSLPNVGIIYI